MVCEVLHKFWGTSYTNGGKMKTKTGIYAITLSVATLTLAACGGGGGTGVVTVTAAPNVAAPAPVATVDSGSSKDSTYVALLRSKGNSYIASASDSKLIELGHQACDVFDSGTTVLQYVDYFVEKYPTDSEMRNFAAYLGGAGIAVYCPEYQAQIDAL